MNWRWSARALTVPLLLFSASVSATMPDTIGRIKPSIVAVGTYQKTRSPAFIFRGTGFAVGNGTLIATNAHVLPEQLSSQDREKLVIVTSVGGQLQPRDVTPFEIDAEHDLALLRINGPPLPALELQSPATVREGETFAFTGFPIGNVLGLSPVTHRGMVSAITPIALPSATARQLSAKVIKRIQAGPFAVFQLDATAYPGNSGSPLYDMRTGHVIGIVNMVFVKGTRESALSQPSGITFAIPVVHLQELLRKAKSAAAHDSTR